MLRLFLSAVVVLTLAACGADNKWASDEAVMSSNYVASGAPTLTLFTVINNRSGQGGHAALMVSGSQRVLFDPAGTFYHPHLPERHDVHYGMTDRAVEFYIDYHARITWHVVRQDIVVSPEVAEQALRAVQAYGAVPKAMCAASVSSILRGLPGFESIGSSLFPKKIMARFAKLPGVTTETFYDDDPEENGYILAGGI